MGLFVGVDIGTTNIKAACYNQSGQCLSFYKVKNIVHKNSYQMDVFFADEIWESVCECLKHVISKINQTDQIVAVGISSMAESGVALDKEGKALSPVICWYEQRTIEQYDVLLQQMNRFELYKITGQVPSAKYGIFKLMWTKKYLPDIYQRMYRWLSIEDYILFKLSGGFFTDYTIASRTLAFDINNLVWSKQILKQAGIDQELLPKPYPGGTKIGYVTDAASRYTTLPQTCAVVTGGHDHACAAMGVNILHEGVIMNSMGTAEVAMMPSEKLMLTRTMLDNKISVYPHCGNKLFRLFTSNHSCGSTIDWFIRNMFPDGDKTSNQVYEDFFAVAATGSADDSLIFLPLIRGAVDSKKLAGTIIGIKDEHRNCDLALALLLGICCETNMQIAYMREITGDSLNVIRTVGGLSRSSFFMTLKSHTSQLPVEIPVNLEAACYGAAVLAAHGANEQLGIELQDNYTVKQAITPEIDKYSTNTKQYRLIRSRLISVLED